MSMTKKEIIKKYEMVVEGGELVVPFMGEDAKEVYEMLKAGLSALRPVTREQVEKVWRGEWHRHYKSGIHAGNGVVCSKCDMWNNRPAHFCPSCGSPLTDKAVDMVMKRLEEICK